MTTKKPIKKRIPVNAEEIVREAGLVAEQAMSRLASDETWLHNRGYHSYSAAIANMRTKIERALGELVEEVMPDA